MIVVDSSAWIEFLRDTDSPACNAVDRLPKHFELRDGFQTAVDEVDTQLRLIRETLEGIEGTAGAELFAAIETIDLAETSIELSWTRIGTDVCARD